MDLLLSIIIIIMLFGMFIYFLIKYQEINSEIEELYDIYYSIEDNIYSNIHRSYKNKKLSILNMKGVK